MGSDLNITKELQEYILNHGFNLHPVQREIIDYNTSLGDLKKMQISELKSLAKIPSSAFFGGFQGHVAKQ